MKTIRILSIMLLFIIIFTSMSFCQKDEKLLPPMGWEPWNIDHCGTIHQWDEDFYIRLADFFVSSGLRDHGYTYISFECHAHYRDSTGIYRENLNKFPNGLKPVIDYLHSRGLKAMAYTDAGKGKCGGCYEGDGSFGHYEDDARVWNELGFDGVKIDWCGGNKEHLNQEKQYTEFYQAIKKYIKKPFMIEICDWGTGKPWEWGRNAGTIWRTGWDIDMIEVDGKRSFPLGGRWQGLIRNIDSNRHPNPEYMGPGKGWNYADMLLVGHPEGLTEKEERVQFGMWAIMASPLFLGNDVLNMPQYAKDIIMNTEVIAVNQDPLGIQGDVITELKEGKIQVWSKLLHDGSVAIAILNRDEVAHDVALTLNDLGLKGKWSYRDLWKHEDRGRFKKGDKFMLEPHETLMFKFNRLCKTLDIKNEEKKVY
jgi:alpha-galactosidase